MDRLNTLSFPAAQGAEETPELVRLEIPDDVRKALSSLALAVNHGLIEQQLKVTAYALRDVPVPVLRRACLKLAETSKFWPRPVEIRDVCDAIRRADAEHTDRVKYLPPDVNERTFRCLKCEDEPNGWIRDVRCPDVPCDRRTDHGPHYFTARCPCWLERHAEQLRLAKQDALQKNKRIPPACLDLDELEMGRYRWAKPKEMWA